MAELYQETFKQVKLDKEVDIQRVEDVHDRFGYFDDEKNTRNKIKDKRYDLPGFAPDTEDEAFSTDFDVDLNPADTEMYRHYKLM